MVYRSDPVTKQVTASIDFTPRLLAEVFADMNDEAQAQFFIEVANAAKEWGKNPYPQWYLIGQHLRACACSTDEAREMVVVIASGINPLEET